MPTTPTSTAGTIQSIWRFPVKSMLGEEVSSAEVTERGLAGDRAYALISTETGKVGSAKNPQRWPNLFQFHATLPNSVSSATEIPPAQITCPDGARVTTDQADIDSRLSAAVGQPVRLAKAGLEGVSSEGYWPAFDWLDAPDSVFEFPLPPKTFFDGAVLLLTTTSTLRYLHSLSPTSRFDVRRFRPNILIDDGPGQEGIVENNWIGRTLTIGEVELWIERPCGRCIMTMLPQEDLPKDPNVLRTLVKANGGNLGVYAVVRKGGQIHQKDTVHLI
ncbi:MOSC domain-containing protein [soil metagenome]